MTKGSLADTTTQLRDLLTQERELLLTGRAREAVALVEPKLAAIQHIESFLGGGQAGAVSAEDRREIQAIMWLARENSVHFEAIRNGLRHAIERLGSMHGNAYVGSYGRDGTKVAFSGATGSFQRKA
ncbi:MAG TPA: hypothetical protein PLR76_00290 [Hyphomonas sp.]|nr:hypothetical protein [Hyphomonas sp.]HPE46796.1 hypothetical protein [Hyphomonas sp.]